MLERLVDRRGFLAKAIGGVAGFSVLPSLAKQAEAGCHGGCGWSVSSISSSSCGGCGHVIRRCGCRHRRIRRHCGCHYYSPPSCHGGAIEYAPAPAPAAPPKEEVPPPPAPAEPQAYRYQPRRAYRVRRMSLLRLLEL